MSWQAVLQTLQTPGVVEYGAFQREARPGTPAWRRPTRGQKFPTIEAALFNKQGALQALQGTAPYPKAQYAAGQNLYMPYVAAWLRGCEFALLARQAAPEPEVTIVPSAAVNALPFETHSALTDHLATLFGEGAHFYGVRFLSSNGEITQR